MQGLRAAAPGAQPGREPDAVDAALTMAAQCDERSPRDAVHLVFQAARTYGRADRHGDAASLFAEVMPYVEAPDEPAQVALTHDQYGQSLRALGRRREAAGQFREAAGIYAGL